MTDGEREPIVIMLRDVLAKQGRIEELVEERRDETVQALHRVGDALGEMRTEMVQLGERFDAHVDADEKQFRGLESDHRELRRRVDGVDETGRNLALNFAEERGRGSVFQMSHATTSDRSHAWIKYVVGVAVLVAISLIAFFAQLAISGL